MQNLSPLTVLSFRQYYRIQANVARIYCLTAGIVLLCWDGRLYCLRFGPEHAHKTYAGAHSGASNRCEHRQHLHMIIDDNNSEFGMI